MAKRRFGDRKDAALIRDMDAMHVCMAHLYRDRTDNEAYISETIDLAPMQSWIAAHKDEEFKYTYFHIIVATILKLLVQRPHLNRFISDRKFYQRNENIVSFVVKRQFTEEAAEGMAVIKGTEDDTVFTVHEKMKQQILPCKQGENSSTEDTMDFITKLPQFLQRWILSLIRRMAVKGRLPKFAVEGDSNHSSVFVTNLGSIGLKCGYHHLSNYGTCSIFVVIGEKKQTPTFHEDGTFTLRDTLDVGLTIDERIADGYYYAKTVKLLKYMLEYPETLEAPFKDKTELEARA
ncbi:MAG: 2-oxo acid dehydrogenase subunit E2 [Oscillospiraceae bacterium]|nr:2-oxo acid dehydrogenase subunit E2 [Oscillospiraceae bacterium]